MCEDDIEECISYVIQTLNQEESIFRKYGGSPDIWQRPALDVDVGTKITIFNANVLPEVVRWLAARYRAQTDVMQEIHRLSGPANNEQGTAE